MERMKKPHRTNIGRTSFTILMVVGTLALLGSLAAQESLRQSAEAAGADWIIGQWTAATDQGQRITAGFEWQLDGHVAMITFKMDGYRHRGMIYRAADKDQVVEVGADNQGGRVEGTWSVEGDVLVSRTTRVFPDGQTMRVANYHTKVDDRTMEVAPHLVEESGEEAKEPWATLVFKRQAEPTRAEERPASR
jgi:hypothetical protein